MKPDHSRPLQYCSTVSMAHFLSVSHRMRAEPVFSQSWGHQPCHRYTSWKLSTRKRAASQEAHVWSEQEVTSHCASVADRRRGRCGTWLGGSVQVLLQEGQRADQLSHPGRVEELLCHKLPRRTGQLEEPWSEVELPRIWDQKCNWSLMLMQCHCLYASYVH